MATLGGTNLSLVDIAKRTDPDGMPAKIAETLHQSNPILTDVPWQPSNLPTGHRSSIRTGLPSVSLRRINEGVASSKGTVSQITDSLALVETWCTTDKKLLDLQPGNAEAIRMSEASAYVEAMGQKVAELMFYGDEGEDDREFNGLDPRYNSLTGNVGDNMLSAGGAGGLYTDIWLVGWAPDKVFGIYPSGSQAGLQHYDHGLGVVQESTTVGGAQLAAYRDQYTWDCGIVVRDFRYVVRIPNVDVADLAGLTGSQLTTDYGTSILYRMTDALDVIPSLDACRPVFYMNRKTMQGWRKGHQALGNANVYNVEDVNGRKMPVHDGIPIRICDQITNYATAIS